jgi:ribosomal protein S27E
VDGGASKPERYGVDAELERLLRCPECGSTSVRSGGGSYGLLGLRVLGEYGAPREVVCRRCATTWLRPPMRDLRREAQRRIDERYDQLDEENLRLRQELDRLRERRDADGFDEAGTEQAAEEAGS